MLPTLTRLLPLLPAIESVLFRYWKQNWAKSLSNPYLNPVFSIYTPQTNDRTMTWPTSDVLPHLTCRVTTACLWTAGLLPFPGIFLMLQKLKNKFWCNLQIISNKNSKTKLYIQKHEGLTLNKAANIMQMGYSSQHKWVSVLIITYRLQYSYILGSSCKNCCLFYTKLRLMQ